MWIQVSTNTQRFCVVHWAFGRFSSSFGLFEEVVGTVRIKKLGEDPEDLAGEILLADRRSRDLHDLIVFLSDFTG